MNESQKKEVIDKLYKAPPFEMQKFEWLDYIRFFAVPGGWVFEHYGNAGTITFVPFHNGLMEGSGDWSILNIEPDPPPIKDKDTPF